MQFDWDPEKAKANLKNHKVSFEEATTVFRGLLKIANAALPLDVRRGLATPDDLFGFCGYAAVSP